MIYRLSDSIDVQPLEDRLVVLDLERNAYYSLNGTARYYLEAIASGRSRAEVLSAAADHFTGTDAAAIAVDFDALTSQLVKLGIITPAS